jgi:hypothetical protein
MANRQWIRDRGYGRDIVPPVAVFFGRLIRKRLGLAIVDGGVLNRGKLAVEVEMATGTFSPHDLKGALILFLCFAMLAFICGLAALSTVMRPAKWSDRLESR